MIKNLHIRSVALGLAIALATLAADFITKQMALSVFVPEPNKTIAVTSFFNLVLVYNYGISFGMLASHNQPLILTAGAGVIILVLLIWLLRNRSLMVASGLGFVIGGAIGNCYDRLSIGAVVDFLDFHAFGRHWPAFNLADSAIFIGVVLLCIHSMFIEPRQSK